VTLDRTETPVSFGRLAALFTCVLLVALGITWIYLGMRSVMDVGGACADGGPYVSAQPCPDGTWMLAVSVPMLVISAMLGSGIAMGAGAPNLLVPMWGLLFGSLGWNFLEYGAFSGDLVWGWIICGVVFELMALPVVLLILPSRKGKSRWTPATGREPTSTLGGWWWPTYAVLGLIGCALGTMSYNAWS
jgi:hypothetical protein